MRLVSPTLPGLLHSLRQLRSLASRHPCRSDTTLSQLKVLDLGLARRLVDHTLSQVGGGWATGKAVGVAGLAVCMLQ